MACESPTFDVGMRYSGGYPPFDFDICLLRLLRLRITIWTNRSLCCILTTHRRAIGGVLASNSESIAARLVLCYLGRCLPFFYHTSHKRRLLACKRSKAWELRESRLPAHVFIYNGRGIFFPKHNRIAKRLQDHDLICNAEADGSTMLATASLLEDHGLLILICRFFACESPTWANVILVLSSYSTQQSNWRRPYFWFQSFRFKKLSPHNSFSVILLLITKLPIPKLLSYGSFSIILDIVGHVSTTNQITCIGIELHNASNGFFCLQITNFGLWHVSWQALWQQITNWENCILVTTACAVAATKVWNSACVVVDALLVNHQLGQIGFLCCLLTKHNTFVADALRVNHQLGQIAYFVLSSYKSQPSKWGRLCICFKIYCRTPCSLLSLTLPAMLLPRIRSASATCLQKEQGMGAGRIFDNVLMFSHTMGEAASSQHTTGSQSD